MTIPEEIEQIKTRLSQTAEERGQADLLMQILGKYTSINSTDSQPYIDRLLSLAENLNEPLYNAWGLHHLAILKRNRAEYGASIHLSRQALALFGEADEKKGIAVSYHNIGRVCFSEGNYTEALKNLFASLKLMEEIGDTPGIAHSYGNIGMVYQRQGNYAEALKNHFVSLKLFEEAGNKHGNAYSYQNIGIVYEQQNNYHEALENLFAALKLFEETADTSGIAHSCANIGIIYSKQGNYPDALKNLSASLKLFEETGNKLAIAGSYNNIGTVYEKQGKYPEALKNYFAALKLTEEIGGKYSVANSYSGIGSVYARQGKYTEALKNLFVALKLAEETGANDIIKECSLSLSRTCKTTGDFENALKYHEKYHEAEKELLGEESQKQLNNLSFMHGLEQKEKQLEIEQLQNQEKQKELEIQHLRNVELKKERDRSESLLLNILPAEVAEELKEKGTAGARLFDDVTVFFSDFVGFTKVSERLTPQQLVDELHACFSAFDGIMGRYGIEKIKTVGDAYLAVSGLPQAHESHAGNILQAATEIRDYMLQRREELGEKTFEIRIGVHSGSVVAGIVGVKKFAYDIWGDTVNTAARMEQNSEAGKINISETTYELVKDKFTCQYRGEIEAKNKGKLKMYFVH